MLTASGFQYRAPCPCCVELPGTPTLTLTLGTAPSVECAVVPGRLLERDVRGVVTVGIERQTPSELVVTVGWATPLHTPADWTSYVNGVSGLVDLFHELQARFVVAPSSASTLVATLRWAADVLEFAR